MPPAKSLFLERISSLTRSVVIDAVTNRSLAEKSHNDVARMLRNGLAVVGFAALEDFIKSRTSEVLLEVGRTNVSFTSLPEKLRNATTFGAIGALKYQLGIIDRASRAAYIQEQAQRIASTTGSVYELTPHAFGYDSANLDQDAISDILKSFLVEDPWREMSKIGNRLGLVAMPLNETFRSAALRRHRAAHVAQADTPQSDISQFIREAYAVAISFDALLQRALSKLRLQDVRYLAGQQSVSSAAITLRTIRHVDGNWKEYTEGRVRAFKVSGDYDALLVSARFRAQQNDNLLIAYDIRGEISSWDAN